MTGIESPGATSLESLHFTSSLAGGAGLNTSDSTAQSESQAIQGVLEVHYLACSNLGSTTQILALTVGYMSASGHAPTTKSKFESFYVNI